MKMVGFQEVRVIYHEDKHEDNLAHNPPRAVVFGRLIERKQSHGMVKSIDGAITMKRRDLIGDAVFDRAAWEFSTPQKQV